MAAIRSERARWIEMEMANRRLQEELQSLRVRFAQEAARSDELAADNAQLQSELMASRLEVRTLNDNFGIHFLEIDQTLTSYFQLFLGYLKQLVNV